MGYQLLSPQYTHRLFRLIENSRDVVINSGECTIRSPDLSAGIPQSLESLRGGDFMDEMPIDVEEGISLTRVYDVVIEDLVVERTRLLGRCRHRVVVVIGL